MDTDTDRITDKQASDTDQAEPRKPARRILEQEIAEGVGELERSGSGLFIAGLSAGLDLGFSLFLMGVMLSLTEGDLPRPIVEILVANMYAIGFIFVVLGRSELFTEHTTLAILPVLNGSASLAQLARLWGIIYVSNILGSAIFAGLAVVVGPSLGVIQPVAFGQLASPLVSPPGWVLLLSAILAGWLMGLLSWLVTAGRDTISQIFFVWLVTAAIGFSHLPHSIGGTTEVLSAIFSGQAVTFAQFGHFLLWTTLGNSIGGVIFVGVIKYSHVIRSNDRREEVELKEGR